MPTLTPALLPTQPFGLERAKLFQPGQELAVRPRLLRVAVSHVTVSNQLQDTVDKSAQRPGLGSVSLSYQCPIRGRSFLDTTLDRQF